MVASSPCKVTWFSPLLAGRDDDAVDDLADGLKSVVWMGQRLGL
jgi:hypothetical protein